MELTENRGSGPGALFDGTVLSCRKVNQTITRKLRGEKETKQKRVKWPPYAKHSQNTVKQLYHNANWPQRQGPIMCTCYKLKEGSSQGKFKSMQTYVFSAFSGDLICVFILHCDCGCTLLLSPPEGPSFTHDAQLLAHSRYFTHTRPTWCMKVFKDQNSWIKVFKTRALPVLNQNPTRFSSASH